MNKWCAPCSYNRCLKFSSSISRYKEFITCHSPEHTVIHRHFDRCLKSCYQFVGAYEWDCINMLHDWYMYQKLNVSWHMLCNSFGYFFKSRNHAIESVCINLILLCIFNVITSLQQCWHINFHYHGYLCMKVLLVLAV
jgi:hypothetical protein